MYYALLQDYARAAYWWRKAGIERATLGPGVHLAECYWKLGNRQMAVGAIEKLPPRFETIKLWADMGDLRRALAIADPNARGLRPTGLDLRRRRLPRGRPVQAGPAILRAAARPARGHAGQGPHRTESRRAAANIEAIKLFDTLDLRPRARRHLPQRQPGLRGRGPRRGGRQGGRIESVRVTEHREKQFYSSMTDTPRKIIEKQSVKGIDATSGATITSEAIINATAKALGGAMKAE